MTELNPNLQYLTYRDVCSRYKIGSTTLYKWIAEGHFPKARKLGPRSVRWNLDELRQWENRGEEAQL